MKVGELNIVAQSAHEIDLMILLEIGAEQDVVELSRQFGIGIQ